MAKKSGPGPEKGENNEILLIVGLIALVFILWTAFHDKFAAIVLAVRSIEIWTISLGTDSLLELKGWVRKVDRKVVTISDLWLVSSMVGDYIRWVTTPVLIGLGIWLMSKSPTEKFMRKFSDVTLPKVEADLYPWMRISVKLDFPSMDTEKGNWAMAKTERQFVRAHRLRLETGDLDKEKTEPIMIKQVGPLFLDIKSMRPHVRALFAMFAIRIGKDFKNGDQLLLLLARSASDGKIDYSTVDEIANKYLENKKVKKIMARHAYERTMLMSMLEEARGGPRGKDYLPPNWFLWLKGVDRTLWYALADVGRETPHIECAGTWGHWLAEKALNKRLEVPFVKNAVEGIALELSKFTNDDDEDGFTDAEDLLEVKSAPLQSIPSPNEFQAVFNVKSKSK